MATKKQKPEETLPTTTALTSSALEAMEEASGAGFENQTREDITIPVIHLLQALSPWCKTVAGAKPGRMINGVTEELLDEFLYVPAATSHEFCEFVPLARGGGFVGAHALDSEVVLKAKKEGEFGKYRVKKPDGTENELIEFFNVFGIVCDETDPLYMAVMRFKSTKIKVYRAFNTRLQTCQIPRTTGKGRFTPPLYCHVARVSSREEKNSRGQEYFNFVLQSAVDNNVVKSLLPMTDPRVLLAAECHRLVMSNKVKASYDEPKADGDGGDDDLF